KRATFGINLQPLHPDYPDEMVWRPGVKERRASRVLARSHPMGSMATFIHAILDTMQNWSDSTQIILPGYRERIAELRHTDAEGGMNLKMDRETITDLANRGAAAAAEFDTFDFDAHRWERYRVAATD